MTTAARHTFATACEAGVRLGFTVSPNWWSARLVQFAQSMPANDHAAYIASWWRGPPRSLRREHTVVVHDGRITIDGTPLEPDAWRRGKTGPGVLRRYFEALA